MNGDMEGGGKDLDRRCPRMTLVLERSRGTEEDHLNTDRMT